MHEVMFKSQLLEDGHLYCPEKYATHKAQFQVIVSRFEENDGNSSRPFGLCKGEFRVPDDFDAPLPEDIF
jgi:hypothetical protein